MSGKLQAGQGMWTRRWCCARMVLGMTAAALMLAACTSDLFDRAGTNSSSSQAGAVQPGPNGRGQIRVGLILPLSAQGNAGIAAESMKNAAEMAMAEFKEPNIQLVVKDDGGSPQGAQSAAQQAVAEGAEIIIGSLFARSVSAVGRVARQRGIPVIAFSTDTSVATGGVYLLSFLPETDVRRIVDYAISRGKHSFAALLPDNAYGSVVEAAFQQEVAKRGGRVMALEKYSDDPGRMTEAARRVAQAANGVDAIFIPDGADRVTQLVQKLESAGVNLRGLQLLGTGLWDDPRIFASAALDGAWFVAPDSNGFRDFATRYHKQYGQDPGRTATFAYDALALVMALAKTQGAQSLTNQVLTNSSGFTGIDGVFRFLPDGTNERGLAVIQVTRYGAQVVSPAPKSFESGT